MFFRHIKSSSSSARWLSGTAVLWLAVSFSGVRSQDGTDVIPSTAKLPDMATVIPQQVQIVNPMKGSKKREVLRFSNGVANIGDGPWRMRPAFPVTSSLDPQKAIQELLDSSDSSGKVVYEKIVSEFLFHPEHNHWHINGIALFEVRHSKKTGAIGTADIGPLYVNDLGDSVSLKTTFCLIDWIKLDGNSNNGSKSDRFYFECNGSNQGISVGWVDEYHQATVGQQLDITNAPPGRYYLISTANPDHLFVDKNYTNNTAWVAFDLARDSQGNAKINIVANSFLLEGIGVPPTYSANR